MKHQLTILLLAIFFLTACDNNSKLDYRLGEDGLIYESGSDKLYTGRLIDTTDVIIEIDVVNGKKTGEFITYYLNGVIEKQGYMNENKNEGEWKYYYEEGTLECKGIFKNDKPTGEWIYYYPSGIKKEEGQFIDGKREGKWIIYKKDGVIERIIDFLNGAPQVFEEDSI